MSYNKVSACACPVSILVQVRSTSNLCMHAFEMTRSSGTRNYALWFDAVAAICMVNGSWRSRAVSGSFLQILPGYGIDRGDATGIERSLLSRRRRQR